jgi:hypothetical protein
MFDYFERDGAIFRHPADSGDGYPVRDILTPDGWKPYTGDRLKPVVFGSQIAEPA